MATFKVETTIFVFFYLNEKNLSFLLIPFAFFVQFYWVENLSKDKKNISSVNTPLPEFHVLKNYHLILRHAYFQSRLVIWINTFFSKSKSIKSLTWSQFSLLSKIRQSSRIQTKSKSSSTGTCSMNLDKIRPKSWAIYKALVRSRKLRSRSRSSSNFGSRSRSFAIADLLSDLFCY